MEQLRIFLFLSFKTFPFSHFCSPFFININSSPLRPLSLVSIMEKLANSAIHKINGWDIGFIYFYCRSTVRIWIYSSPSAWQQIWYSDVVCQRSFSILLLVINDGCTMLHDIVSCSYWMGSMRATDLENVGKVMCIFSACPLTLMILKFIHSHIFMFFCPPSFFFMRTPL